MLLVQKTTLITTIVFLILLSLLGLMLRVSVLRGFQNIEDQIATEHVLQVKNEILNEQTGLNATVGDWASWTDTRDYALGSYPGYINDNMMDASYTNLNLNFMWIGDAAGHELFAKTVDLESGSKIPFSDGLRQYIITHPQLTQFTDVSEAQFGIISLPYGLAMIAAQPIRDSDNHGPIVGSLIMGKYLNKNAIQALSERARLAFDLYRWDDAGHPEFGAKAQDALPQKISTAVKVLDDDTLVAYTVLNDIEGHPAAVIEMVQPRSIFKAGWNSLTWFFGVMTLIALLMIVAMIISLNYMVLRRVTNLDTYLANIALNRDLEKRLTVSGKDELSNLIRTLNGMMDALQGADEALRNAHDQLEKRVVARTAELTQTVSEKNVLLKEVHHRVKNNLQIISSLLSLQARNVDDPQTLLLLTDSQSRVRSMALVHEKLYQSEALDRIKFNDYLRELTKFLYGLFWKREGSVEFLVQAEAIDLDIETAVPCGLLVNELITNSLKHAFPETSNGGTVHIQFSAEKGNYALCVSDNGIGFSVDSKLEQPSTLGMQLIKSLTLQLKGNLDISTDNGTTICITFPEGA